MDELDTLIRNKITTCMESFFANRKVTTKHVLDPIFPQERRIRSLIGGLETSFGTKFWETLASDLARNNGFDILDKKKLNKELIPKNIPSIFSDHLNTWKTKRENYESIVDLKEYIVGLQHISSHEDLSTLKFGKMPKGDGVDLWLKKENTEYLFDIKTTQTNARGGPSYNEKIMNWYLYRILEAPGTSVICQIAFPFNPYPGDFWQKAKAAVAPLIPKVDAVVENEFWSFLSGNTDTWSKIDNAFTTLGAEGYGEKFKELFSSPDTVKIANSPEEVNVEDTETTEE